jgi:large conductance mechanosensitive channel
MLQEFKNFAMKGNVVDLAIGVIIGAAFGKIVTALIDDIIMPIIGIAGKVNFNNYFVGLSGAVTAADLDSARKQGNVLAYGDFITVIINFLIVALALFFVIRGINSLQKPPPAAPAAAPPPSDEVKLLTQIRDALVKA